MSNASARAAQSLTESVPSAQDELLALIQRPGDEWTEEDAARTRELRTQLREERESTPPPVARRRRTSVAGDNDRSGDLGPKPKPPTASEVAAAQVLRNGYAR